MSRCQRECHRFEPDILLHLLPTRVVCIASPSSRHSISCGFLLPLWTNTGKVGSLKRSSSLGSNPRRGTSLRIVTANNITTLILKMKGAVRLRSRKVWCNGSTMLNLSCFISRSRLMVRTLI